MDLLDIEKRVINDKEFYLVPANELRHFIKNNRTEDDGIVTIQGVFSLNDVAVVNIMAKIAK